MATEFNIIESDVKIVKLQCRCPNCHRGFLERYGNQVIVTYPEQFEHRCNKCGFSTDIRGIYYPRYVIKDGDGYAGI